MQRVMSFLPSDFFNIAYRYPSWGVYHMPQQYQMRIDARDGKAARTGVLVHLDGALQKEEQIGAEETRCHTGGPDAESASSWRLRSAET
jgi:hypothetical protein